MATSSSVLTRRLYRSLLRASAPFSCKETAKVYSCFLYRSGLDDISWEEFLRSGTTATSSPTAAATNLHCSGSSDTSQSLLSIFRKLVREVIAGDPENGILQMQFPSHITDEDPGRLRSVIRREFREGGLSGQLSDPKRKELAFLFLRKLNEKLTWVESMKEGSTISTLQPAETVTPLPLRPPSSYLRPGAFLVAHPMLNDSYFSKAVICILSHAGEDDPTNTNTQGDKGTYGLIINRLASRHGDNGEGNQQGSPPLTLHEILRPLPDTLAAAFANCPVREGGPVMMSVQMVHQQPDDSHNGDDHADSLASIGGNVIPMIPASDDESSARHGGRATVYRGDVMKAAEAVLRRELDPSDEVSFFVGASCWSQGQLESEMERGYWMPCRGPPELVQSGRLPLAATGDDVWASMLAACGPAEAELAALFNRKVADHFSYAGPCDAGPE